MKDWICYSPRLATEEANIQIYIIFRSSPSALPDLKDICSEPCVPDSCLPNNVYSLLPIYLNTVWDKIKVGQLIDPETVYWIM